MSVDFIQQGPSLTSALHENSVLNSILRFFISIKNQDTILNHLKIFENKIISEVEEIGRLAELNPPQLVKYSAWGKNINHIEVSSYWKWLHHFSAQESLIADGYLRPLDEDSRLLQLSKLYLFHPSSAFYSCPLAMTDGAAKVLEKFKNQNPKFEEAFKHLISTDPLAFWTSGQWMTEKTGGSDVSHTSTVAVPKEDHYELSGIKWFSSATTSEMSLGLARIAEGQDNVDDKLSLFFIPMRNEKQELNGINILRLKDKLGTKALPTAELELKNTKAYLIGERGQGVKTVAMMLNITRIYNSICSVAHMERCIGYLEDYSKKRIVFGKLLIEQSLQAQLVSYLKAIHYSASVLTFYITKLLGQDDLNNLSDKDRKLLRLLTPITKMYSAKHAVYVASETVEGIGGAGYIEDTKIPVLFRDAQVFPIWEGATNVLSLDVLRVLRDKDTLSLFLSECDIKIKALKEKNIKNIKNISKLEDKYLIFKKFVASHSQATEEFWQCCAKDFAWGMGEIFSALLMGEIALHSKNSHLEKLFEVFVYKMSFNLESY